MTASRRARRWLRLSERALFAVVGSQPSAGTPRRSIAAVARAGLAVARARHAARHRGEAARAGNAPDAGGRVRGLVGRIEVPRLQLSALAREGVDTRTLRGAVGHIPGTALPGEPATPRSPRIATRSSAR